MFSYQVGMVSRPVWLRRQKTWLRRHSTFVFSTVIVLLRARLRFACSSPMVKVFLFKCAVCGVLGCSCSFLMFAMFVGGDVH